MQDLCNIVVNIPVEKVILLNIVNRYTALLRVGV